MQSGYRVGDVMKKNPVTVAANVTLQDAAKLMRDKAVGSLLVVEDGKLIGIVTKTDLVRNGMASGMSLTTPIDQVMTHEHAITRVSAQADLFETIEKMNDHNIKHLPVSEGRDIVGIITMTDVLTIEPQIFNVIAEKLNVEN